MAKLLRFAPVVAQSCKQFPLTTTTNDLLQHRRKALRAHTAYTTSVRLVASENNVLAGFYLSRAKKSNAPLELLIDAAFTAPVDIGAAKKWGGLVGPANAVKPQCAFRRPS